MDTSNDKQANFLKRETESPLIAAPYNAVRTNHIKARKDKTQQNSRCRLCSDRDETMNHVREYNKLAHHHHHVTPPARISLTLSRHPSLSSIAPGRSSRLHPVSARSYYI